MSLPLPPPKSVNVVLPVVLHTSDPTSNEAQIVGSFSAQSLQVAIAPSMQIRSQSAGMQAVASSTLRGAQIFRFKPPEVIPRSESLEARVAHETARCTNMPEWDILASDP